mmetsp:Transcript_15535/g.27516  ORF Transcript_15535/g.27516 Transcript_15535/m.27516 type:complete len:253 (+) Transcript_15535:46-804(+)
MRGRTCAAATSPPSSPSSSPSDPPMPRKPGRRKPATCWLSYLATSVPRISCCPPRRCRTPCLARRPAGRGRRWCRWRSFRRGWSRWPSPRPGPAPAPPRTPTRCIGCAGVLGCERRMRCASLCGRVRRWWSTAWSRLTSPSAGWKRRTWRGCGAGCCPPPQTPSPPPWLRWRLWRRISRTSRSTSSLKGRRGRRLCRPGPSWWLWRTVLTRLSSEASQPSGSTAWRCRSASPSPAPSARKAPSYGCHVSDGR